MQERQQYLISDIVSITEFSKVLIAKKHDECIKLISKYNDSLCSDPTGYIDLVIADYDFTTSRILDYIQKRAINDETKRSPIMSVVVLVAEAIEKDTQNSLVSSLGANAVINIPCPTQNIFIPAIELIHKRIEVEAAYKDLKQNLQSIKYPFLPIFTAPRENDDSDEENGGRKDDSSAGMFSTSVIDTVDAVVDDWLECASLLPEDMEDLRRQVKEKRPPPPSQFETKEDQLSFEVRERVLWDRLIIQILTQNQQGGGGGSGIGGSGGGRDRNNTIDSWDEFNAGDKLNK